MNSDVSKESPSSKSIQDQLRIYDLWPSLKTLETANIIFMTSVRSSVRPSACNRAKATGQFPLNLMFGIFLSAEMHRIG